MKKLILILIPIIALFFFILCLLDAFVYGRSVDCIKYGYDAAVTIDKTTWCTINGTPEAELIDLKR